MRMLACFAFCAVVAGAEDAPPAIDLPLAAHATVPADAASMLVVTLTKDGHILAGEKNTPMTLEELGKWLGEHKGPLRKDAHGLEVSDATVCIRADKEVPWRHVQWVLIACAENYMWRTRFAARAKADGPAGTVDAFLPCDPELAEAPEPAIGVANGAGQKAPGPASAAPAVVIAVHVVARKEAPARYGEVEVMKPTEFRYRYGESETTDLQTVQGFIHAGTKRAKATKGAGLRGELKAGHKVPMEGIVALLEAYHAAGCDRVDFYGTRIPTPEDRRQAALPYPLTNYPTR